MRESSEAARAAEQEADYQRWADDGGRTPDARAGRTGATARPRSPWAAVGVAAAVGFALGWLTGTRD